MLFYRLTGSVFRFLEFLLFFGLLFNFLMPCFLNNSIIIYPFLPLPFSYSSVSFTELSVFPSYRVLPSFAYFATLRVFNFPLAHVVV